MLSLPTWVIARMLLPFFSDAHPWKGRKLTLKAWRAGQTELCRTFDVIFWISIPLWVVTMVLLMIR